MATTYAEEKSTHSTVEHLHDDTKEQVMVANSLPMSLRHLSPDELEAFRKKLVRKIDIRLMPMLIILFLLKYIHIKQMLNRPTR